MPKKKIAFIVAIPGTAHAFLKDHIIALSDEYDINLIANFPDEESRKEFTGLGVTCHQVPIMRKISLLKDLKALLKLALLFKKEKFISVHSVTPKAGILTSIAAWLVGVPHRIHIYTGQVWAAKTGPMRSLLMFMDGLISFFDTDILVDGESQRQFLIKEGIIKETKSRVLANGSICGVKLEMFNATAQVRTAERAKFGFKEEDVVYVFMGRLNHDKGIGELYEAFNRLAGECGRAKLLLYGTDEEDYDAKAALFPNLKRDENFFYPGSTTKPFDSLQAGDAFVMPTWREGFGSSVIEAQALALPVITSDAYGVMDASVPDETGLRCKINDSEVLYLCMKTYCDHPDLRKKHGEAGRRRVGKLFDNRTVTAAWVEYYHELLG